MLTHWKYVLRSMRQRFKMPINAQVLAVQLQGDLPALWARVDTTAVIEERTVFVLVGATAPYALRRGGLDG